MEAELARTNSADTAQIRGSIRLESVDTMQYLEKEQGFLHAGQALDVTELLYVDHGSVHWVCGGADQLLHQGDMVLCGPGQWHMQYADMGIAPRLLVIRFDVTGRDLSSLWGCPLPAPQQAVALLQQMLKEQERSDEYSGDMILALLTQLLLTLRRHAGHPAQKLQTPYALHNENEIILHAQQYISAHIRDRLSVPLVARKVDVSPSYLTALFHKHLQIAPGEYIRRAKLQESKQMIRENNMNFTEIAAALQYSTVHHFSRQFKEKFGITPTQYAKSVR